MIWISQFQAFDVAPVLTGDDDWRQLDGKRLQYVRLKVNLVVRVSRPESDVDSALS